MASKFITPLQVKELGEDRWELLTPLIYASELLGREVMVPTGFVTDMESVPRWLPLAYATLYGTAHAAGVLHDWLYTTGDVSRRQADAVLFEAVCATGQPRWRAWVLWLGVRAGGWIAWNAHRKS